jgi:hypothetical protein
MNRKELLVKQLSQKIEKQLGEDILKYYDVVKQSLLKGDWEKAILNSGKLCEVMAKTLLWLFEGNYKSYKDVGTTCTKVKSLPRGAIDDSLRVRTPRIIEAIYDIRTHRGTAHHKSEIDPNQIDAHLCASGCDWLISELIRLFHVSDFAQIKQLVEELHEKKIPTVEEFDEEAIVLLRGLSAKDEILLILYNFYPRRIPRDFITRSLKNFGAANIRASLSACRHEKLVHEDGEGVKLTKSGINEVETRYKDHLLKF